MNRSWVRFPQAAQIRPPGSGWAFLCVLVACGPTGVAGAVGPGCGAGLLDVPVGGGPPAGVPAAAWLALMGRAAVCAGGRRPAREIATREPAARSGRSRGPPWPCHRPPAPRPGPAFCSSPVPSGPSGALHTSGAGSLMCGSARRLEARPSLMPRSALYPQFRMQFPDACSLQLYEKPGISTITIQSMKCARGNCMRMYVD